NRPLYVDALARYGAGPGEGLDAAGASAIEGLRIGGIDVARERKSLCRADLDDEQHHGAGAHLYDVAELRKVFRAAIGDAIGKLGESLLPHQMHVLDLEITGRPPRRVQEEIDARSFAVFHLAPRRLVTGQVADDIVAERFSNQCIRMAGVDADELGAAAEICLDQFPAIRQLAFRILRL